MTFIVRVTLCEALIVLVSGRMWLLLDRFETMYPCGREVRCSGGDLNDDVSPSYLNSVKNT